MGQAHASIIFENHYVHLALAAHARERLTVAFNVGPVK